MGYWSLLYENVAYNAFGAPLLVGIFILFLFFIIMKMLDLGNALIFTIGLGVAYGLFSIGIISGALFAGVLIFAGVVFFIVMISLLRG